MASLGCGFSTDGEDGEHTKGATPFLGGESQPSIKIEHVCAMQRCGGAGSNQGIGRVVEQAWLPDAVISELKERFCVRAIAQAPPKYDSASAGMVENAIKHVKERVRTLVTATRELHGA